MAERFEIPKRFSREWWEYMWDCYNWHFIITAVIVFFVCLMGYKMTHKTTYDMRIIAAGNFQITYEQEDEYCRLVKESVKDFDGNGKITTYTPVYFLNDAFSHDEMENYNTYSQKLYIDAVSQENVLYIFDKSIAERFLREEPEGFLPVEKWIENAESYETFSAENGIAYGVSLKESSLFKQCKIDGSEFFVLVRDIRSEDEKIMKNAENAIEYAKEIIK